jgi:hypothetical protein
VRDGHQDGHQNVSRVGSVTNSGQARPLPKGMEKSIEFTCERELIIDVNFVDGEGGPKCTKCRGTQIAGSYQTPVHEVQRAAVVDQHPRLSDRSHEGESTSFQSRRTMP